jgi:hypothetical protein
LAALLQGRARGRDGWAARSSPASGALGVALDILRALVLLLVLLVGAAHLYASVDLGEIVEVVEGTV